MKNWISKAFGFFKYLLELETVSTAGKYNLIGTVFLLLFVLAYTLNDSFCYLISAAEDTIKTWRLGENIDNTYQTVSVLNVFWPVLIGMGLCFFYLVIDDRKKKNILEKEQSKKNGIEKEAQSSD